MPSISPPLPHHYTPTTSSHYPTAAHSWGRFGFHQDQPAAMYDTASDLYSPQVYASTDHIVPPPGYTFSSPAQQAVPPTTRYSSPMSRHPAWAYPSYTQLHSAQSAVDARASSFESSIAHKVWLVECKHCLTFLTNRGMKAVLLLRPHVALYSTDALPINCSAYAARSPSTESQPNQQQPRTCECLTQTLCCHGCGTSVGYTIVVPCIRCMSSGSTTNRVTNGHRFVFHSSELIASERHYTPGEPGILPAYTERPSRSSPLSPNLAWSLRSFLPSSPDTAEMHPSNNTIQAFESPCPGSSPVFADPQKPSPQRLRAGDILYWHHLKQGGEIPGAVDDPRARGFNSIVFDR